MTKAVSFAFIVLLTVVPQLPAQNSAPNAQSLAVNQAVLNQANTLVLRQKLVDARTALAHGDLNGAAKLYEDAYTLVESIGSGIPTEKAQTISGLTSVRIELARRYEQAGDYVSADKEITRALKVDPKNPTALALKKRNDAILADLKGKIPDAETLDQVKPVMNQKADAATLVRDGKLLYEMGKLEEAEVKLNKAIALDPDNQGAFYYLQLCKQAAYGRQTHVHNVEFEQEMVHVQDAWNGPLPNTSLPTPNPYATNDLIYTGTGRQEIVSKLDRIHLDKVSFDGLPLSEVVRTLSEQSRIRDPEKKGINFIISSVVPVAAPVATGVNGVGTGAPTTVDPATGLPIVPAASSGGEQTDINSVTVKLNLNDVRLADLLDAIVEVADHPIKYSIRDYAVVFSPKGAEQPTLYSRHYKIDPNTFYQGMESVAAISFAGGNNNSGSGSGGGGNGGGGGGNNGQNSVSSYVGVVNAVPGAGSARSSGGNGGGGGGGGGGGTQGGAANPLNGGGVPGGAGGGAGAEGGIKYVTKVDLTADVSLAAKNFFAALGVNLDPPKTIFFNDRLGELFVRATEQDLDTIESAVEMLNQVAPQVHVKSRFIEVEQDDSKALGFDWYLGQFNIGGGDAVGTGGSSPSLTVPPSAANPPGTVAGSAVGTFPGNTAVTVQPGSTTDQLITSGLRNTLGAPALGTITGILTDPNFRVVLRALEQRSGFETLAAPEVTTTSGRQTQMRATVVQTVVTGFDFQQGSAAATAGTTGTTP
ncbi:MAG TPA: tetratricopeptide repeat protein [Verrucomicrobiae bacterium]|nr:tetratricopeptide repeat protein [Verrucomicrobiae bacterium]